MSQTIWILLAAIAVPSFAATTCFDIRCRLGFACRLIEGKPKCVTSVFRRSQEESNPCATNSCPADYECELREVQCIDPPCPPIGLCKPSGNDKCGTNETFKECASQCEPTCVNKSPICIQMCAPGKCQCKPGFYRNTTGQCVTEADCGRYLR